MTRLVVTGGRGPIECRVAVARVVAEIVREAAAAGLSAMSIPGADPDGHGPLSIGITLRGQGDAHERSQHRNRSVARARLGEMLRARQAQARSQAARHDWGERIAVERGNAVRVYEGEAFRRMR